MSRVYENDLESVKTHWPISFGYKLCKDESAQWLHHLILNTARMTRSLLLAWFLQLDCCLCLKQYYTPHQHNSTRKSCKESSLSKSYLDNNHINLYMYMCCMYNSTGAAEQKGFISIVFSTRSPPHTPFPYFLSSFLFSRFIVLLLTFLHEIGIFIGEESVHTLLFRKFFFVKIL